MIRTVYRNIGILDHMGHGNLGDAATQDAILQNLKRRCPNVRIVGFSLNPTDTQQRHNIPSFAIRRDSKNPPAQPAGTTVPARLSSDLTDRIKRLVMGHRRLYRLLSIAKALGLALPKALFEELLFLLESFRIIRTLDLLIFSGGGQLNEEWGGPWGSPYTILKWALLAKATGVDIIFLNVGAGTLSRPLSQFFVRRALLLAKYCSFRDERTQRMVKELGFDRTAHVFPDSVYILDVSSARLAEERDADKPTIGLGPMPYCDPRVYPLKDQKFYSHFINELAMFAVWLIKTGHTVTLFGNDVHHDSLAINDLKAIMEKQISVDDAETRIRRPEIATTDELLSAMASMDYVVTCRFHGVIFANLLNKPVLAVSHHPKVATLMDELGLSEYYVEIRELTATALIEKFQGVVRSRQHIKTCMSDKLEGYRRSLTKQFDDLFLGTC